MYMTSRILRRTMKLLTHNMLTSNVKGVKNGFPLIIEAEQIEVKDVDFNPEFISRILPKLQWKALVEAAEKLGHRTNLPTTEVNDTDMDEEFLHRVHHVLLEVEVVKGSLTCPETGKQFPIKNGIPNMLLNEDEV